jgi:hypothetical protein
MCLEFCVIFIIENSIKLQKMMLERKISWVINYSQNSSK